ncbi:MAG: HDIG domain-containing protein [Chloroflexota bacterium]|nr:HDIG domain-containing protein [Chloroflexota bacterium]
MFVPRTLAAPPYTSAGGTLARAAAVALLLAAGLTAILSFTIIPGQFSLAEGDVAQQTIQAPRRVTFESGVETEAARHAAEAAVEPVYVEIAPRADIRDAQLDELDSRAVRVERVLAQGTSESWLAEEIVARLESILPELSPASLEVISTLSVDAWQQVVAAARAVVDETLSEDVREDDLEGTRDLVRNRITETLAEPLRGVAGELAAAFVTPNTEISVEQTEAARQRARDAVAPVRVDVRQGETVVREGERITALDIETLNQLGLTQPRLELATLAGNALLAVVLSGLLVAFLVRLEPAVWHRNRTLLLFMLALLVTALAIKLAGGRSIWSFMVPSAAAVMLIAILLDGYTAAALAAALAVVAGTANGASLEIATVTLAGGMVSVLALARAERLNAFVRAGLLLGATNVGVTLAFSLLGQRDLAGIVQLAAVGVANAGLSVILAVGSFAVLGNLFGISTIFQLLELANPSSPLLRRLLLETPGTYHHSVMVGNLGERAAETIGADALLVRVGAYYHDIGKMKNPLAFIENQAGARNIHDELPAETSARIIASHIRDGIDLGYQHRLPVQIIGFIPQHHGTSVMSYFYGKAVREADASHVRGVDDARFRYPGPKPQSREAAILMLADGVEASVRSIDDKDEASIRAMVDRIVDARVEDGQLDDADLTLKDIRHIKEAFVQQLLGMYHSRIKYPENVVPLERRGAG